MNPCDALALQPQRIVELSEDAIVGASERRHEQLNQFCWTMRSRSLAKSKALTMALLAILAMPIVAILSSDENRLEKLQMMVESERAGNDQSAILAVDTSGVIIRSKGASPSTLEMFEQTVVEHLAKLHSTYSEWANKNQALMGSLLLKIVVDPSGTVVRVEPAAAHLSDSGFITTIVASVRRWKFPKSNAEAAQITMPLLFIPKGMDTDTVVQWERTVRGAAETKLVSNEIASARPVAAPDMPSTNDPAVTPWLHQRAPAAVVVKAKSAPAALVTVKTNRQLAIRDNPRFSAKSLGEVDEETPLSILENRGDWLKVKLADAGMIGFVRKEYVSPIIN